tara:strand:- start:4686 stop:5912 length:1227 start_codon:yes stop_codon:yes gene_type:complete
MPDFKYTIQDRTQTKKSGTIEAENKSAAARKLRETGNIVLQVEENDRDGFGGSSGNKRKKRANKWPIRSKDKIMFLRQLSVMLRSGLTLMESIRIIEEESEKVKLQNKLNSIIQDLQSGSSFSQSLKNGSQLLPVIAIEIISSAEQSGDLAITLERVAETMVFWDDLKKQTLTVLIYPAIVFALSLIVIGFLVFFFIPILEEKILSKLNKSLPFITQLVVDISHFFTDYWVFLSLGTAGFITTMLLMFRNKKTRRLQERILLSIPFLGKALTLSVLSQFASSMSVMLKSGINVLQAIDSVSKIVQVQIIKDVFIGARPKLLAGAQLRESIDSPYFPQTVYSLISAGENSGNLPDSFNELKGFYSKELESIIGIIVNLTGPILILSVGFIVAFVYIAMIMALLSVYKTL